MTTHIPKELTVEAFFRLMQLEKPTIPDVMPYVLWYYNLPSNGAGGSLHIVLDDGNISDFDVQFCIDYAKDAGDVAGVQLGQLILKMSKTQRLKLSPW